jgi:hypothetical protein
MPAHAIFLPRAVSVAKYRATAEPSRQSGKYICDCGVKANQSISVDRPLDWIPAFAGMTHSVVSHVLWHSEFEYIRSWIAAGRPLAEIKNNGVES